MSENSPYFDAITAQRAMLLSEEEALLGNSTISMETQEDLSEQGVISYIEENFEQFLNCLRYQSKEDQELLLSYYLLAKTQTVLGMIHRTTQTLCSFLIRQAVARIGTFILLGEPTEEVMHDILVAEGLENALATPLSKLVAMYARCRSFQQVADKYRLHRPDVRRAMRNASNALDKKQNGRAKALGAYLQGLLEKASASGQGLNTKKRAKSGHIYCVDPPILGEFRIDVLDPNFHHVFTSRANL